MLREFPVVGHILVTQIHTVISNAWLGRKVRVLGIVVIDVQYFHSPMIIIIAPFSLHRIIR